VKQLSTDGNASHPARNDVYQTEDETQRGWIMPEREPSVIHRGEAPVGSREGGMVERNLTKVSKPVAVFHGPMFEPL